MLASSTAPAASLTWLDSASAPGPAEVEPPVAHSFACSAPAAGPTSPWLEMSAANCTPSAACFHSTPNVGVERPTSIWDDKAATRPRAGAGSAQELREVSGIDDHDGSTAASRCLMPDTASVMHRPRFQSSRARHARETPLGRRVPPRLSPSQTTSRVCCSATGRCLEVRGQSQARRCRAPRPRARPQPTLYSPQRSPSACVVADPRPTIQVNERVVLTSNAAGAAAALRASMSRMASAVEDEPRQP